MTTPQALTDPKEFNSLNLLGLIFKHWKKLAIIAVVAAVASAGASFLIRPKYKSTFVFFAARQNSTSKSLLSENPSMSQDVLQFGEEEEAEQMIQILNSEVIRDKIIKKYNLMRHYDIDPNGSFPITKLRSEFDDNIKFSRTEYMSVRIEVLDTDPDTAALIANDIAALLDTVKNAIVHSRAKEALKIVQGDLYAKEARIKLLDDSLGTLRDKGVFDYEKQVERLIEAYGKALVGGNTAATKTLQAQLDTLGKYGRAFVTLRDQLIYDVENLSLIKKKYDDAKVDAESFMKSYFEVNRAFPAERKTTPVRWLIVLVSVISSLLLGIIVLIGLENYKVYKANQQV
jgi:uncharacterized protein involved in exopolysaccharide biosynthesis